MRHYLIILLSLCVIILFSGCQSQALRALIKPQEWTNYAITEGVTCTDPAMIDGDAKTRGVCRWQVDSHHAADSEAHPPHRHPRDEHSGCHGLSETPRQWTVAGNSAGSE